MTGFHVGMGEEFWIPNVTQQLTTLQGRTQVANNSFVGMYVFGASSFNGTVYMRLLSSNRSVSPVDIHSFTFVKDAGSTIYITQTLDFQFRGGPGSTIFFNCTPSSDIQIVGFFT